MQNRKRTYKKADVLEMLKESNGIEGVYGEEALEDAYNAWKRAQSDHMTTSKAVLGIHKALMKRLNPRIAGKVRTCPVYIGKETKKYTSEADIIKQIRAWMTMIAVREDETRKKKEQISEQEIRDWHVAFEDIHPFEDGNGRTGRILYNLHRKRNKLPIDIIYEDNKWEYYEWFQKKEDLERIKKERESFMFDLIRRGSL